MTGEVEHLVFFGDSPQEPFGKLHFFFIQIDKRVIHDKKGLFFLIHGIHKCHTQADVYQILPAAAECGNLSSAAAFFLRQADVGIHFVFPGQASGQHFVIFVKAVHDGVAVSGGQVFLRL